MKELALSTNAIDFATLTLPSAGHSRSRSNRHRVKDNASCEDVARSVDDPRRQASRPSSLHSNKTTSSNSNNNSHLASPLEGKGAVNGSLSRPHSESSGEFSLSLDQEVWSSNGSSPVQQPPTSRSYSHQSPQQLRRSMDPSSSLASSLGPGQPRKTGSPHGNEVLSLQQFLDEGIDPAECGSQESLSVDSPHLPTSTEPVKKERNIATKGRGILRSMSGRAAAGSGSDRPPRAGGQPGRPSLRKTESTRVKGSVQVRPSLSSQGKAMSVSERLDATAASSTLPRASSVISTAEGTTRRTSIHDLLSKDNRQPVSIDTTPPAAASAKSGPRSSQPTPNVEGRKSKSRSGEAQKNS